MLVLSRKQGERIRIGRIIVTVLGRRGGRILVGIEAPSDVRVVRDELGDHPPQFELSTPGKVKPK